MTSRYRQIDPSVLLDAAGQDVQAFLELSATFLDIAPPMFERLQQAIQAGHTSRITLESHSLKGTVALVGAERLAGMLGRVEALSRSTSDVEIPMLWSDLADAYAETIAEVRSSILHFEQSPGSADNRRNG
ncbi:Hpt domain-containing protein [Herbaspirillum sp. NPDC101396]|uniref:Hpt domain-containing protein n=1 Tax=Herbaspirillum sp. NPDC101396 TaxID=3364005 RepID=UPI00383BDEE7